MKKFTIISLIFIDRNSFTFSNPDSWFWYRGSYRNVGIGGGLFFIPVLYFILLLFDILSSELVFVTIGTSAVVIALTIISSSASFLLQTNKIVSTHLQFRYVLLPVGLTLGAGAVIGTFPDVNIGTSFSPKKYKKIFSIMLIIAAVRIILIYGKK